LTKSLKSSESQQRKGDASSFSVDESRGFYS
jgi:hypothetical protein